MCRRSPAKIAVVFTVVFAISLMGLLPNAAIAQRARAPELLPIQTLAYLRIADSQDLVAKFNETGMGRMSTQEQIQPLMADLYGAVAQAFTEAEEELGVSLAEMLAIPRGEVVMAVVRPPQGPPAIVMLMDVGESRPVVEKLIERGETEMANDGWTRSTEKLSGHEAVVHRRGDNDGEQVVYFFMGDTLTIATNQAVAADLIRRWQGGEIEAASGDEEEEEEQGVLADNDKFVTIMNRCKGTKDARPQLTWFVDPIELARAVARGNLGAQAGMAILPVLGLDGVQGVGGSLTLAAEDFDMIAHVHLSLDTPRSGVVEMVAFRPGDTTPEPWVPHDVASYTTLNWDVDLTYRTLGQLYDSFRGEGRLAADVKRRISDEIGVDFEKDILPAMEGRVTIITWFEPPAGVGSRSRLIGVKLNDAKEFQTVMDKIIAKFPDTFEEKRYSTATYYEVDAAAMRPRRRRRPDAESTEAGTAESEPERESPLRARIQPCMGIVGDYLLIADRPSFFEKVVAAKKDTSTSLASDLEYKIIASKIRRQPGGAHPAMVTFDRPEMAMRMVYDLVESEDTRQQLADRAVENDFFSAVDKALRDNPLPPFAVLQKYMAPAGGMITDDETGIHYMGFSLRRE